MKIVSAKEIQHLDKVAIEHYGLPSIVLMENAGRAVAQVVIQRLKNKRNTCVVVVCGLGNNAGDGLVCARYLLNSGVKTKIFLILMKTNN